MIEFKNIKKSFGAKIVLNDVSHVMETGKANLIIGTSGSGKTVLQKCLVGLFEPDEGEIIYDGVSFSDMNEDQRKQLRQQIRQNPNIFPNRFFVYEQNIYQMLLLIENNYMNRLKIQ